jgi:hypothetical protein
VKDLKGAARPPRTARQGLPARPRPTPSPALPSGRCVRRARSAPGGNHGCSPSREFRTKQIRRQDIPYLLYGSRDPPDGLEGITMSARAMATGSAWSGSSPEARMAVIDDGAPARSRPCRTRAWPPSTWPGDHRARLVVACDFTSGALMPRTVEISPKPTRAAQYVRMSTEHQTYSIDHQTAQIAAYALSAAILSCAPMPTKASAA